VDDLRALLDTAERRAEPPPFDALLARAARARRTRATLIAVGSVAATVAAVLLVVPSVRTTAQQPAVDPTSTPTPADSRSEEAAEHASEAARIREIVEWGTLVGYAGGPAGTVMTLWTDCGRGARPCVAWRILRPDGSVTAAGTMDHDDVGGVMAAGEGFLVTRPGEPGTLVEADGRQREVTLRAGPPTVHAGLLGVPLGEDSLLLDPLTATAWTLPRPPGAIALTDAVVDSDGRVWAEAWMQDSNPRRIDLVCTADPARGWQHRTLSAAGDLGGAC
jgi:hypothetical protein